jgi:ABC-type dipeptide/oligopeptide/nickel transport system permease subunit
VGARTPAILLRHIAPNVLGPMIILWSTSAGVLVMVESALSLLGLGVQAPGFSLGSMLADSRTTLQTTWWAAVFPGVAIMLVVVAFNLLGDALRDAFNPSARADHDPELW